MKDRWLVITEENENDLGSDLLGNQKFSHVIQMIYSECLAMGKKVSWPTSCTAVFHTFKVSYTTLTYMFSSDLEKLYELWNGPLRLFQSPLWRKKTNFFYTQTDVTNSKNLRCITSFPLPKIYQGIVDVVSHDNSQEFLHEFFVIKFTTTNLYMLGEKCYKLKRFLKGKESHIIFWKMQRGLRLIT